MLAEARRKGVPIAIGSDAAHRFPHIPTAVLELEYLEALGYPTLQVIRAATSTAAAAIGRGADRGQLVAGQRADLLVVEGDVAASVRVLRDPRCIWRAYRGGRLIELDQVKTALSQRIAAVQFEPMQSLRRSFEELQAA